MKPIEFAVKLIRILFKIGLILLIAATATIVISTLYIWNSFPTLLPKMLIVLVSLAGYWLFYVLAIVIFKIAEKFYNGTINVKKYLDFGLASREEVIEKLGEEVGQAVLEERKIVFWRFGFLWAIFGALVVIILQHYFNLITILESFIKYYLGVV